MQNRDRRFAQQCLVSIYRCSPVTLYVSRRLGFLLLSEELGALPASDSRARCASAAEGLQQTQQLGMQQAYGQTPQMGMQAQQGVEMGYQSQQQGMQQLTDGQQQWFRECTSAPVNVARPFRARTSPAVDRRKLMLPPRIGDDGSPILVAAVPSRHPGPRRTFGTLRSPAPAWLGRPGSQP